MMERASGTIARARKGPIAPPPRLDGVMETVAEAVASWRGVVATAHWDLYNSSRVDGIDFYVGEDELGHIHLDGSIHLATNPSLGKLLIAEGLAERFPYARSWYNDGSRVVTQLQRSSCSNATTSDSLLQRRGVSGEIGEHDDSDSAYSWASSARVIRRELLLFATSVSTSIRERAAGNLRIWRVCPITG